jgi:hypothetical protein
MKKTHAPLLPSRINKNNKKLPNNKRVTESEKKKLTSPVPLPLQKFFFNFNFF